MKDWEKTCVVVAFGTKRIETRRNSTGWVSQQTDGTGDKDEVLAIGVLQ